MDIKCIKQIIILSLTLFLISCKEETNDSPESIKIVTGKSEYPINSMIIVKIKNDVGKNVFHFTCDNVDICPSKIFENENGVWIESEHTMDCTQCGSKGYIGTLAIHETIHDTILLFNKIGKFKLRYQFVIENDTLIFDSNEFLLQGLEL